MQMQFKNILALAFLSAGLMLSACNKDGGAGQAPTPPPPQCVPGQPCTITPPGSQCPFGQYWNGTSCVAGSNITGYQQYFGNLNITNTNKAEDIVEVLTGQYFCLGFGGYCPNYSQGSLEIVVFNNQAQVRMNIGGYNMGAVNFWGQGLLRNINNDTGSEINILVANLNFTYTTSNYRLDLGGTKDGAKSSQAPVTVLFNNGSFAAGTLNKYSY